MGTPKGAGGHTKFEVVLLPLEILQVLTVLKGSTKGFHPFRDFLIL